MQRCIRGTVTRQMLFDLDGDLDGFGLLDFRYLEHQHTMLIGGLNLAGINTGRESDGATHLTFIAFAAYIRALLALPLLFLPDLNGQRVGSSCDLEILWLAARQRRLYNVLLPILCLIDIQWEGSTSKEFETWADHALLKQPIHRLSSWHE